jgi:hypothetical protein
MTDFLHVLLGAALVSIGVLVSALADRIRQLRAMYRAQASVSAREPAFAPAREPAFAPAREARAPKQRSAAAEELPGSGDVVAVLIAAGYRKPVAAQAVAACSPGEQVTPESWTRAALRRCAQVGGAS